VEIADYSFIRYLSAKRTIDDRALNQHVWQTLVENLPSATSQRPLRVLEIGCGIGTMLIRMLGKGLLGDAEVTAIDVLQENISFAHQQLVEWGRSHNYLVEPFIGGVRLTGQGRTVKFELERIELFDFIRREAGQQSWDLLIAHAFLDLLNVRSALPQIFELSQPGGWFYFSLNFDGMTSLQPIIEPTLDELIERLYHQTMDSRITAGQPSGDSQTGRHLFSHLLNSGATILAAGASDWVVFPTTQGYPADEAYFLHFIINTMAGALIDHPDLDLMRFKEWIDARHAQVDRGELIYIAHQLDFVGRWEG
jgi:SAM-dependent methyltransferase